MAALSGYATVSGTYQISAKYCTPGASNMTFGSGTPPLQILTHGIGFDKTYWDLAYNAYNYSYVNNALNAGYHTLSYDRLGIGNSSHGEPKNEIQSFLEVAALAEITNMARNGSLTGVPAHDRVIHVGHSFGSAQTYSLVNMYPNISDGIVLTGFSMNASFVPLFTAGNAFEQAYLNQPLRFGNMSTAMALNSFTQTYQALTDLLAPIDLTTLQPLNYPPGYLVNSNAGTTNFLFLHNGNFDPSILFVGEKSKQPVTVGEALTLGSVPMMNSYTGPALIVTGEYDVPYCGGNCLATGGAGASIPAMASMNLPMAQPFQAYIQPNTGHGINLHYNATGAYNFIQNWLSTNNLGAMAMRK